MCGEGPENVLGFSRLPLRQYGGEHAKRKCLGSTYPFPSNWEGSEGAGVWGIKQMELRTGALLVGGLNPTAFSLFDQ